MEDELVTDDFSENELFVARELQMLIAHSDKKCNPSLTLNPNSGLANENKFLLQRKDGIYAELENLSTYEITVKRIEK